MIVLISPAKSMDFERKIPELNFTNPVFHGDAVKLVKTITPLGEKGLQDLMKLSKKLSELNNNRFLEFEMRPKNSRARPAIFSFNGDVYDGINIDSFTIEDIYYAQRNLRILSGLYGLLKPLDLIQPHRLEMGTKLKNAKGNNLYDWWHSRIAQELKKEIVNGKSEALINLASLEYFKSVEKYINLNFIAPVFQDYVSGEYKTVGVFAKKARGLMTSFILKNKLKKICDLKEFNSHGYKFHNKISTNEKLFFRRRK